MIFSENLFKLLAVIISIFSLSQISKGENIEAIYNQDNSIQDYSFNKIEKPLSNNSELQSATSKLLFKVKPKKHSK